jgi:biotin carboxyl carrier protein
MTFEIELNGRLRAVSVERAAGTPGRFRVIIDGEARLIDAARAGEHALVLLPAGDAAPGAASTRSHEVQLSPGTGNAEVLVNLRGRTLAATVNGRRTGHAAEAAGHGHGAQAVVAPMPGRVVRVLVAPGDEVTARQGVVVVEAMKMENELRAPKAGRVTDVAVTPGMSVDMGRVLVVIE